VGDPLAVDITIDGSGNFDALNPPSLMPPDGWKPYPPRRYNVDGPVDPNLTPTAQRRIGYSMVFVPEKQHTQLPPFELSYFSPTQKKYVIASTAPIPLRIKPGAAVVAATGTEGTAGGEAPKPPAVQQPKAQHQRHPHGRAAAGTVAEHRQHRRQHAADRQRPFLGHSIHSSGLGALGRVVHLGAPSARGGRQWSAG
jgi:hypothetical protein